MDEQKVTLNEFEHLVESIRKNERKQSTLLIGIDGCGGSGKSTIAQKLKEQFSHVDIVHMDDFYLPSSQISNDHPSQKPIGADYDWPRVLKQVLEPLMNAQEASYQRYDWDNDKLEEWHTIPCGSIVIIEGVYATRKELANYYDFKIWMECPRETRLSRGLERDGENARDMWVKNWMVSEDIYMEACKPRERADFVVDGTR
ncbi:uridine kinase [Paenisporosarcina sp. TG20]|uniref:uridine kinase family protein n=1 Tax=Paenisporosarcina sp. TG20 TaxID=1211706 RepID=UPI0002E8CCB8|nr:AAA family ATPase [Paenisporosarcina sp. TG20]